jgi:DNA repair protein SbcC/Rad50
MRLTRLELENWMGIPRLELDFSAGINLVYGRNEIGKSSIIEAIRHAIMEDASSRNAAYKKLNPWGSDVKAQVKLFFESKDDNYQLYKSFPVGKTELLHNGVKIAEEAKKTREKLYNILDISEKTTNLLKLLFINQGESLNIFSKTRKDNPLDENTKSYIKEVVKETAFREIQEFQDYLDKELNSYLTSSRKKVAKNTKYNELLDQEKELVDELEKLQQKVEQFQEKIEEIEKADLEISRLQKEVVEKSLYIDTLKKKKERMGIFKDKRLAFKPIENDYDEYAKTSLALDELRREFPGLLAYRLFRINERKTQIKDLEDEKKQSEDRLSRLKLKKQERVRIDERKRAFEKLKTDYDELKKIERQTREIQSGLPLILKECLYLREEELKRISEKLRARSKAKEELSELETKLKCLPKVTQKEIKSLRKIENDISRLNDKITSFREELKLDFHLVPDKTREISYAIDIDGGEPQMGKVKNPIEISGFQKLHFNYAGHFDIHVAGNLTKTDYDALKSKLLSNQEMLKEKLSAFKLDSVDELEQKYAENNGIKNERDQVKVKLGSLESRKELEKQKDDILNAIETLKQDNHRYAGNQPIAEQAQTGERKTQRSVREISERLSKAKANLDSLHARKKQVLEIRQCTFLELENEFKLQENELQKLEANYRKMKPENVTAITENHIDEENSRINAIEKNKTAYNNEIELLVEMEPLNAENCEPVKRPVQTTLTTQQIRDGIKQNLDRSRDLEQKKKDLLREMSENEFKMNYIRRKDELEALQEEIEKLPPLKFKELEKIDLEIIETERGISSANSNRVEMEKNRERWIGETREFSEKIEEKSDKEQEYREVLNTIKGEISEIASLQLLLRFIDDEKEKAQQEIFKPLQDKVVSAFSTLVGERYKIQIDNDLNLEIAGKTITGDYQTGIENTLSFGTKEQLSFLFRLAIATQLSGKEPVVMVLDDSFVNTDLSRFPLLLEILCEQAADLQFLIFTCRPSEYISYFPTWIAHQPRYINLEERMGKIKS